MTVASHLHGGTDHALLTPTLLSVPSCGGELELAFDAQEHDVQYALSQRRVYPSFAETAV